MSAANSFAVTASTMVPLMQMFEMGGVYISASRGAVEIIQAFEAIGIDVSNIHFLDLVSSGVLGGTDVPYPNVTFVDSPIMLGKHHASYSLHPSYRQHSAKLRLPWTA
jgi:hypothetical protein